MSADDKIEWIRWNEQSDDGQVMLSLPCGCAYGYQPARTSSHAVSDRVQPSAEKQMG